MPRTPKELLEACERARQRGKDFPTIWRDVLRPNPLVIGLPGHDVRGGAPCIVVSLSTGDTLLSGHSGYRLA